jgi:antitoxin component of MazEF toxin-antitoxin module
MTTAILREQDGSLGVVIPSSLLDLLGLKAGARLEIDTDGRRILIQPASRTRPTYSLAQLLEGLAPDEPLPTDEEWERAPPIGKEAL